MVLPNYSNHLIDIIVAMETKTVNVCLATACQFEGSKYIEVRKGTHTKRGEFILT